MEQTDLQYAQAKLAQLKTDYQVEVLADWGESNPDPKEWKPGTWTKAELDRLHTHVALLANLMGGNEKFVQHLGGVTVRKADIGTHGGEALAHQVTFSTKGTFSAWTVVHEFSHSWDANYDWRLSRQLEKYTRGFTSPFLSTVIRSLGLTDSGRFKPENKPGRYGRRPGCNKAGYFYGDCPSGSNWAFNRKEDFAESVTMYAGWSRDNELSSWAEARIKRYLLEDGARDQNFGIDNWMYYRKYFYPQDGDYTKTKRWQFVDDLINGKIEV